MAPPPVAFWLTCRYLLQLCRWNNLFNCRKRVEANASTRFLVFGRDGLWAGAMPGCWGVWATGASRCWKLDDWGVPSCRSDVWSGASSDKTQSPVSRVRHPAQRAARDAWLAHVMLALLFPPHLEGIGGVEPTAVFARGKRHASLIYQVHQMGKGFAQRIEFLIDGPFVPVGVLP